MALERQLLTDLDKNASLRASLLRGDAFAYAHLVKFEKPLKTDDGESRGQATDYTYLTDGSYPIEFDDGTTYVNSSDQVASNGPQLYIPGKLMKVGQVSETTAAKASNMNITVSAAALGVAHTAHLTITTNNTCLLYTSPSPRDS